MICIECVKSGNRKKMRKHLAAEFVGAAGFCALLLVASVIFFPGQVLLLTMLVSIGAILTGVLAFTLTNSTRWAVVTFGLAGRVLSGWTLTSGYEVAQQPNPLLTDCGRFERFHGLAGEGLHSKIDDWIRQKFGELSPKDRELLMQIFSKNQEVKDYRTINLTHKTFESCHRGQPLPSLKDQK